MYISPPERALSMSDKLTAVFSTAVAVALLVALLVVSAALSPVFAFGQTVEWDSSNGGGGRAAGSGGGVAYVLESSVSQVVAGVSGPNGGLYDKSGYQIAIPQRPLVDCFNDGAACSIATCYGEDVANFDFRNSACGSPACVFQKGASQYYQYLWRTTNAYTHASIQDAGVSWSSLNVLCPGGTCGKLGASMTVEAVTTSDAWYLTARSFNGGQCAGASPVCDGLIGGDVTLGPFKVDRTPPVITGPVTPANVDYNNQYVDGVFDVSVSGISDAGCAGGVSCKYCVAADGTCDTEWAAAVYNAGVCTETGAVCSDGDSITINMRVIDDVRNVTTATAVARICDDSRPTIVINSPAASVWERADFTVDVTNADSRSGLGVCEYRVISNGVEMRPWTFYDCAADATATVLAVTGDCRDQGADMCNVDFRATDNVGNQTVAGYASRTFSIDWTPPPLPSVIAWDSSSKNIGLTTNTWYAYPVPYFEWLGVTDLPGSSSGFRRYTLYFGTDPAGEPNVVTTSTNYTPTITLVTGYTYYLRGVSEDNIGNFSATTTLFVYKYDPTAPDNPVVPVNAWNDVSKGVVMANNGSYSYNTPYFEWDAPNDKPANPARAGVDGYYVDMSTDPTFIPSNFTTATSFSGNALECSTDYYLRMRTRDLSSPSNNAADITAFHYYYAGIGNPVITDNQADDDVWHRISGQTYDVDFSMVGCGRLTYAEYTFWSAANMSAGTGTEIMTWTTFLPAINARTYTTDWPIRPEDFALATEGINFVSVRVYDTDGDVASATDVFYFRKDTTPPTFPTYTITENNDYMWISPVNGRLYYGLDMTTPQTFTVLGTGYDSLSGLSKATFSTSFGDTPPDDNSPADWTADYDIAASNTTAETVTVTLIDIAGNTNTITYTTVQDNRLFITYQNLNETGNPTYIKYQIYYPDGATKMTLNDATGVYATTTAGIDESHFFRIYNKDATLLTLYDDINDAAAGDFYILNLAYQTGAADTCGAVNGTDAWCITMKPKGCQGISEVPFFAGFRATGTIITNHFYAQIPEERSISGDLGPATAPPINIGTPGSFYFDFGPNYLKITAMGDATILKDKNIHQWCTGAGCPVICNSPYCSNTPWRIALKPDFVKRNSGAGLYALTEIADNAVPASGEWAWDTVNHRIMTTDDPNAPTATMAVTMYGASQEVCVGVYDRCDSIVNIEPWRAAEVQLDLTQAPGSGKDFTSNGTTSTFTNITAPAAGFPPPDTTTIRGNLNNGLSCAYVTADSMPSDTPQTPIKVSAVYYGTATLAYTAGSSSPIYLLIKDEGGLATDTPGFSTPQITFEPTPVFATVSMTFAPVWSQTGVDLAFISRQTAPCEGAAASGDGKDQSFNIYKIKLNDTTFTDCVRLTRNSTIKDALDPAKNTSSGIAAVSDVTWSNTADPNQTKMIFSARDNKGNNRFKLMWISATSTIGSSTGTQEQFPPSESTNITATLSAGGGLGSTLLTVNKITDATTLVSFAIGQQILVGTPGGNGYTNWELTTITAIDTGVPKKLTVSPALAKAHASIISRVLYPVSLRDIGQSIAPLSETTDWLDPNLSTCTDITYKDTLLAIRKPYNTTNDYECTSGSCNTTQANGNPNIVLINGTKTTAGVYKIENPPTTASANITKITNFPTTSILPLKPKWSPDCKMIAFVAETDHLDNPPLGTTSKTNIYIINLTRTDPGWATAALPITTLTSTGVYKIYDYNTKNMPAYMPNWSADGTIVSYAIDTTNQLDLVQSNSDVDAIVQNMYYNLDYDNYMEYIEDQPETLGGLTAPQLIGRANYNEFGLSQCPGNTPGATCPNAPNYPWTYISATSRNTGALRIMRMADASTVTENGGLLFQEGIVTAVFPPNVIASDTVFYNTQPTAYCHPGEIGDVNCPLDPNTEFIVQAGNAREFFPDGTNFNSYARLIFHYCDNDGDGKIDAGTEGIETATNHSVKTFSYNGLTNKCYIEGTPTGGGDIDVDTLAVYNWDRVGAAWVKMDGVVNKITKTITIFTTHFSRYDTLGFKIGAPGTFHPLALIDVHPYPNPYTGSGAANSITFSATDINTDPNVPIYITVRVYDIRGTQVTTLTGTIIPAIDRDPAYYKNEAYTLIEWTNPSTPSGRPLASGIYLYYLSAEDNRGFHSTAKGKFTVVR